MKSKYLPNEPMENVLDDEITLTDDDKQCNMRPSKERKLFHVVPLDETEDEPNKADDVQTEADESMIGH